VVYYGVKAKEDMPYLGQPTGKLKEMWQAKVREQQSIETTVVKLLKVIGVELSSYHGGSFNVNDTKKVMSHIFDHFATIFKEGKRVECLLETLILI